MFRASKTPFVLSIGLWFSLLAVQHVAAQTQGVGSIAPVRISELGLDDELTSAIDLVGPDHSSAGDHRSALIQRLQCWIDGIEGCAQVDRNDPRVRAIRRYLSFGTYAQDSSITVLFPDDSRIELRLTRNADASIESWDEPAYASEVLLDTARAPGVPAVPLRSSELERLAQGVDPEIERALERLKARLNDASDSVPGGGLPARSGVNRAALVQKQP